MRRASEFPQLAPLVERWAALRDEARAARAALGADEAPRLLPLFPQPRGGRAYAERFPVAASMCRGVRGVLGAAVSILPPGSRRAADEADRRAVTALLCLDGELAVADGRCGGGELFVLDGDETRNDGPADGMALLIRLEAAPEAPSASLARRVLHEIFEAGRPASEMCAADAARSLDKLATTWRAFADLRLEIVEVVGDAARASCVVRARGRQTSHLHNLPATGAACAWTAAFFFTFDGARVAAVTIVWDLFELLQQLREALRVG